MKDIAQIEVTPEYLASQGLSPTFEERFWKKVYIDTSGMGCWLWVGSLDTTGYGRLQTGIGKTIAANRASWILNYGPIPDRIDVLHHCDNPPCVRPDHLWLGTHQDNMDDMIKKGRAPLRVGERNGRHKLTVEQVIDIRSRYIPGITTMRKIAEEYGVTRTCVGLAIKRRNWSSI